jgi:hypothetical protein
MEVNKKKIQSENQLKALSKNIKSEIFHFNKIMSIVPFVILMFQIFCFGDYELIYKFLLLLFMGFSFFLLLKKQGENAIMKIVT